MANFQLIKCKNQWKTSPNRRNYAVCEEIGVGEWNDGDINFTGSAYIAVSAHAQ